jgi:hypothetical protein
LEVHDLEFGLATPGTKNSWIDSGKLDTGEGNTTSHDRGSLAIRSNIADREDLKLVPGEVLYQFNPFYFRTEQNPPQIQVEEKLYYEPCAVCRRRSNDPLCVCATQLSGSQSPTHRLNR